MRQQVSATPNQPRNALAGQPGDVVGGSLPAASRAGQVDWMRHRDAGTDEQVD
jgi:hypothetical protein